MSLVILAQLISITANILLVIVFVWVISTWILNPYHPVREALGRIVEPLLAPIRRIMPFTGGIDFSPMVLLILIKVVEQVLSLLLLSLR